MEIVESSCLLTPPGVDSAANSEVSGPLPPVSTACGA